MGSVDGKVAIEYFESFHLFSYTFKGHKSFNKELNKVVSYPVNDIAYYPVQSEGDTQKFLTCGSDGFIRIWDSERQKRVASYQYSDYQQ